MVPPLRQRGPGHTQYPGHILHGYTLSFSVPQDTRRESFSHETKCVHQHLPFQSHRILTLSLCEKSKNGGSNSPTNAYGSSLKRKTSSFSIHTRSSKTETIIPKWKYASMRRGRTSKRPLSKNDILSVIEYPQGDAALLLGVSLSTLKRRFYELDLGRWPYPQLKLPHNLRVEYTRKYKRMIGNPEQEDELGSDEEDIVEDSKFSDHKSTTDERMKLSTICNDTNLSIDEHTGMQLLERMIHQCK